MAVTKDALAALEKGVEAEIEVLRISWRAGGARTVERSALAAAEATAPALIETLVRDLVGEQAVVREIVALTEQHFLSVVTAPTSAKSAQARLVIDALDDAWLKQRAGLQKLAAQQGKEEAERVAASIQRLDEHLKSRFAFITWTSRLEYTDAGSYVRSVKAELSKSRAQPALFDELSSLTTVMPFLKNPPAKAAAKEGGEQLLSEIRKAAATGGSQELLALNNLERFCPQGDIIYDEAAHIIDAQIDAYLAKGKALNQDFLADTTSKVQGRIGETLALRSPKFKEMVWNRLHASAEVLRDRLNNLIRQELHNVPDSQLWRVEVITEPVVAMQRSGFKEGALADSGIWLIRESDSTAMPIFILEVKSGEIRGTVVQQVLNRERLNGGLIRLPATGRSYRLAPPPDQQIQYALATTQNLSKNRMLGLLKGDRGHEARLTPGESVLTFRIPLSRKDIRHTSLAAVEARLKLRGLKP